MRHLLRCAGRAHACRGGGSHRGSRAGLGARALCPCLALPVLLPQSPQAAVPKKMVCLSLRLLVAVWTCGTTRGYAVLSRKSRCVAAPRFFQLFTSRQRFRPPESDPSAAAHARSSSPHAALRSTGSLTGTPAALSWRTGSGSATRSQARTPLAVRATCPFSHVYGRRAAAPRLFRWSNTFVELAHCNQGRQGRCGVLIRQPSRRRRLLHPSHFSDPPRRAALRRRASVEGYQHRDTVRAGKEHDSVQPLVGTVRGPGCAGRIQEAGRFVRLLRRATVLRGERTARKPWGCCGVMCALFSSRTWLAPHRL